MDNNKKKKLNIMIVILSILAPILVLGIGIGLITAWYTNVIQTGDINASTQNMSIKYTINNSTENILTYDITNLVFFDANSTSEGQYLEDMAFEISLDLENNSSVDVNYRIMFDSKKTIVTSNDEQTSRAYAACVFDDVTKDLEEHTTVNSYMVSVANELTYSNTSTAFNATKYGTSTLPKKDDTNPNANKTNIKLYVFGIQDIDTASSDDFLYNGNRNTTRRYTFTISIIAEPNGTPDISENKND